MDNYLQKSNCIAKIKHELTENELYSMAAFKSDHLLRHPCLFLKAFFPQEHYLHKKGFDATQNQLSLIQILEQYKWSSIQSVLSWLLFQDDIL